MKNMKIMKKSAGTGKVPEIRLNSYPRLS